MTSEPVVRLNGIAYVEVYVANAYQASYFYQRALGFSRVAIAQPSAATPDRTSVMLQQGDIRLVLTAGQSSRSAVARHVDMHGDTVRDVAFLVDDAAAAFARACTRGAQAVMNPTRTGADGHEMIKATIAAPGDTVHSFVEVHRAGGEPWPGFQPITATTSADIGLADVDHVAVGLEEGELDRWVKFYKSVLGFRQSHAEMIWTTRSGMNSKVVEDENCHIRIPMVEPAGATGKSQIDDYLACHNGAGAQHVAFGTRDIVGTMQTLSSRGIRFLSIPHTYYDDLRQRIPHIDPDERGRFEACGVLVDSEDEGMLLQSFTEPLHHRPTLFLELIERRGAKGFGGRNIQALFEAVERDRAQQAAGRVHELPASVPAATV